MLRPISTIRRKPSSPTSTPSGIRCRSPARRDLGTNKLDNTFGPQVKFLSIPNDLKPNRLPSDGLQFFGMVNISGQDEVMTVSLHNLRGGGGEKIYSVDLSPEV